MSDEAENITPTDDTPPPAPEPVDAKPVETDQPDPWREDTEIGLVYNLDALALLLGLPSTDTLRAELAAQSRVGAREVTIPPHWLDQAQHTIRSAIEATGTDDHRVVLAHLAAARDGH
jgi:hypothetical protein